MFCIRLGAEILWRVSICAVSFDLKGSNPGSKLETNSVGAQSVVHGSFVGDQVSKMPKNFEVKSCNCCTTGVEISTLLCTWSFASLYFSNESCKYNKTFEHLKISQKNMPQNTVKKWVPHSIPLSFFRGVLLCDLSRSWSEDIWPQHLDFFSKRWYLRYLFVNTLHKSSLYQTKLFKKGAGH